MDQAVIDFVEQVGLYFENMGLPATAGRILGHLLVCEPHVQSSAELAEALHSTGGSISTNTRMLVAQGLISRVPVRGRRGSFFTVADNAWELMAEQQQKGADELVAIMEQGLRATKNASPESRKRLVEATAFYTAFGDMFREWIEDWRAKRS